MPSYDSAINVTLANQVETLKMSFTNGFMSVWYDDGRLMTFNMLQLHFHAPSEHTIDLKAFDAEVHLVHNDPISGNYAVLGFFFDTKEAANEDNPFLTALMPDKWATAGTGTVLP